MWLHTKATNFLRRQSFQLALFFSFRQQIRAHYTDLQTSLACGFDFDGAGPSVLVLLCGPSRNFVCINKDLI